MNKCINAIRFLAIDGVNKAKSGHPGLPMGAAPMAYVLYNEVCTVSVGTRLGLSLCVAQARIGVRPLRDRTHLRLLAHRSCG